MTNALVKIYFDGGSRGNPGPAAGAAYTDWQGGHQRSCYLASATNNEAEYRGLLMAIELAIELKLTHVNFFGDSKLVVMQVSGEWQAKHPLMHELRQKALQLLASLPRWRIDWIRRELNGEADRVANEEMDRQLGVAVIPPADAQQEAKTASDAAVKPGVRADIAALNRLGSKAGFGDFKKLKVGGMDAYSRASLTALEELVDNYAALQAAFSTRLTADRLTVAMPDEARAKLLLQALRWSARGLDGELALRKVLVDLEVTNNIRGKKS